ncbi:MAG TPA: 1-(5-phosphoribosyl)-5-[(5-phosphoribosylamino)methylideneamino]imidazole-4-carboxamide isomerase [Pyrinomonadaceae bacterium]|nr:1-(5-phosphoribosyl)-5-[(5-phosphoribosylamino)methylideneamino]imidazole-4-carboxamide isomerase [Pyrinomonadaceae bacterium]
MIPAIDLKDGSCVRLAQGARRLVKVYDDDPLAVAERFVADGAQMIHVVDLDGAFSGKSSPNRAVALEIISAVGVPVQFGGGLRSLSDIQQMIEGGAARVVLGTMAVEMPEVLDELTEKFGARVCVGIDARDGRVMTRGWETRSSLPAVDLARRVGDAGIERIVYTDVARDGMLAGPDIEQTREIARVSGLKVTASGGVSSVDDIRGLMAAREPLIDSVIVGKALYEGRFNLTEALKLQAETNTNG